HIFDKIDQAIAGRLRANQAAAKGQSLAGKDTGRIVRDFFHHAGHKADLPRAYADVASRNIGVGAEMPVQLQHERLAEAHYLAAALALWVKVGTALAAAHWQRGQGILEGLLECQKLEDG